MASAGARGSSLVSPITSTLIRVSSFSEASVIRWWIRLGVRDEDVCVCVCVERDKVVGVSDEDVCVCVWGW